MGSEEQLYPLNCSFVCIVSLTDIMHTLSICAFHEQIFLELLSVTIKFNSSSTTHVLSFLEKELMDTLCVVLSTSIYFVDTKHQIGSRYHYSSEEPFGNLVLI